MKNRLMAIITCLLILIITVIGILLGFNRIKNIEIKEDELMVVTTLFPQYDFAKQILGDKGTVSMLLPAGTDVHSYEPTPLDIIKMNKADIFIYTGETMEPWATTIAESIDTDTTILDVSKNINLIDKHDIEEYEQISFEENHEHDEHTHSSDPHIWLNLDNAIIMIENIKNQIIEIDKENKEYYEKNALEYIRKIKELSQKFDNISKELETETMVFAGPFAYSYFIDRYKIKYIAAYESCGEDVEPSVSKIKEIITYIKEKNISSIYYKELSNGNVAEMIANDTGVQKFVFNTLANPDKKSFDEGKTYIDLMTENLENLRKLKK